MHLQNKTKLDGFICSHCRIYNSVLRVALNLEVTGKRKRGRPKKTWKKQVEEETEKIGLKKEDALRRDKWRDGVREIAEGMG